MNTTELTTVVTTLVDDLDPDAASSGAGLGFLLAEAEPINGDAALLDLMVAGFRLSTIGDYLMAAAATRAQAIGVPVRKKLKTGRDLLRALPLAPSVVGKLGRLGDNLIALPHMAREVRDGDLSLEHADAMIRGITHVASRMSVDGFAEVKDAVATALLAHARMDNSAQVAEKARELAHELAPAHPPVVAPADNHELNETSLITTDEGRVEFTADLDQVSGEKIFTALDALSRPMPAPDGSRDPRTRARRLADGLIQMVEVYLARDDRPTSGGVVPHINLTVPLRVLIPDSPAALFEGEAALGDSVPRLGFTGPLSPQAARELACGDNEVAALLLSDGVPLSISNDERLAAGRLRIALAARDHGCQFPGCGKLASWCRAPGATASGPTVTAHHIKEWAAGGETCLANMCLLCPFHHHTAVHTQGWKIRMGSDGFPGFDTDRSSVAIHSTQGFQAPEGGEWMPCHQRRSRGLTLTA